MARGICVWNEMSMGICRSKLSTCSVRPRKASNMMPSFSAKAWIAAHILPLRSFQCLYGRWTAAGHNGVGGCTSLHASPSMRCQPLSRGGGSWPCILP